MASRKKSPPPPTPSLFYLLLLIFLMFIYFWERQSTSWGGTEREGDTESEAGSRLWAISTDPNTGLELTNCEITTWTEVRRLTDWATQAPQLMPTFMNSASTWYPGHPFGHLLLYLPVTLVVFWFIRQQQRVESRGLGHSPDNAAQKYHYREGRFLTLIIQIIAHLHTLECKCKNSLSYSLQDVTMRS